MTALTAARPGPGAAPRLAGHGGPAAAAGGERSRRGHASGKADYLSRLAKIEGQVRGLQRPGDRGDLDHHVGAVGAGPDHPLQEAAAGLSPATSPTAR